MNHCSVVCSWLQLIVGVIQLSIGIWAAMQLKKLKT